MQAGIDFARDEKREPLTFAVLDPGGTLVTLAREDGAGLLRPEIAVAKAWGVLGLGINNREIGRRAAAPEFFTSVAALAGGRVLSVPGGVFVRDEQGRLLGAVCATGDTSLNGERAAVAGIRAVGLVPETDADEPAERPSAWGSSCLGVAVKEGDRPGGPGDVHPGAIAPFPGVRSAWNTPCARTTPVPDRPELPPRREVAHPCPKSTGGDS